MNRGKRESPVTIRMHPPLKKAIRQIAKRDNRSVSSWVMLVLEKEPSVQIVLQQIGAANDTH